MKAILKVVKTEGLARILLLLFLPAILGLVTLALISRQSEIPISTFVREYKSSAKYPYVGLVSDIGILIWTATASICIFSSIVLRKWKSNKLVSDFFLYIGVLTTILMIDDFFLIHESVTLQDRYIFAGYLIGILVILVKFRTYIQSSEYELLFISLFFFGMSLMVDLNQHGIERVLGDWRILLEDGFKILGIVGWFGYLTRCCFFALASHSSE